MTRPVARLEASLGVPDQDDDHVRALAGTLRTLLEEFPQLAPDPGKLADQLAPMLALHVAATPGETAPVEVESMSAAIVAELELSPEARVLEVIRGHEAGIEPGLAPESLSRLTGLSISVVGSTVCELVQAGRLIRDAWLIRLPRAEDLVSPARSSGDLPELRAASPDPRTGEDRRESGDRRVIGDRRLYERRALG